VADRHAASIEKRLSALASTASAKKAPVAAQRPVERVVERHVERVERQLEPVVAEAGSLRMAAGAAVSRGASRAQTQTVRVEAEPKRVFKGFSGWGNFMPLTHRQEEMPVAANESYDLVDFGRDEPKNADLALKHGALDLVTDSGVDLDDVLQPPALERIALSSRNGPSARRRTVSELAPAAVSRIARHVSRNARAQELASEFRARPDLAKSDKKGEGSDLVRAYLLIDAALAS
jgi:hypothetical protein